MNGIGKVRISWPDVGDGPRLQTVPALTPPQFWQIVTKIPEVFGTQRRVALPLTQTSGFYRLYE